MKITELRPMLWIDDLEGSIEFYSKVLGFSLDVVNQDWGWASLSFDTVSIMFTKPLKFDGSSGFEMPAKIGCAGSFYFNTNDVDGMWAELKDRTTICYGIEDFEHGMRELRSTTITDTFSSLDRS